MDLCFGKTSRKVAAQNDVDKLWSTIVREIPGLAPHRDGLEMRYVDDEGDDILVTTNDELEEALQVGKETNSGFLSLKLSVTGMAESTRTLIEETASRLTDDESTEDEAVPECPGPARVDTGILQLLHNAGSSAVAEINSALASASTEIDKMFMQLGTASAKQKKTEAQLATAEAELADANSKCTEAEQQAVLLTKELEHAQKVLVEAESQKQSDAARLQDLENQVTEAAEWENKCKVAEKERLKLDQQLTALRSALKTLTMAEPTPTPATTEPTTKPTPVTPVAATATPVAVTTPATTTVSPVTAEVVSDEIVPSSPVVESPPPYEEPASLPTFPTNCSVPSPEELKKQQQLQQLRDMGFNLTLEQLNEKLEESSGNMAQVVHSLLCM